MAANDDILGSLQADVATFLSESVLLDGARVMVDGDRDFQSRLDKALAPMAADANGKRGLAIIVSPLVMEAADPDLADPNGVMICSVVCLENLNINRKETIGTKVTAFNASLRVFQLLHNRSFGGSKLQADKNPIISAQVPDGFNAYTARLSVNFAAPALSKVECVKPSTSAGALALTCATEGAEIHYTLDGSFPSKSSDLYTDPIPGIAPGTVIRASAYVDGREASDVLQFTKS